tara:strand:- start:1019 stop:1342 length:324 start_codon:yes stop_codon:yes gene_type:complete
MAEKKDKKIIFDDSSQRHARLKIRLEYDGLSQAEFFRCFITGYLEKDERIISYLQSYKLKKKSQSKRNMKIINKDKEKSEDLLSQFGIKDKELENIFDLIAKEHPDL